MFCYQIQQSWDKDNLSNLLFKDSKKLNWRCFYEIPLQLWQLKKNKLDQCLQLRMFEQDCEKMFDWIYSNREVFLANYVDIGRNHGKQQSPPTIAARSIESYFVKESHLSISLSRILAQFLTLLFRGRQQASRRTRSIHSGIQCKFQPYVLSNFLDLVHIW